MALTIHATPREIQDLNEAVRLSCACTDDEPCSACQMLAVDERAINGLIYIRRHRLAQLLEEEFAS